MEFSMLVPCAPALQITSARPEASVVSMPTPSAPDGEPESHLPSPELITPELLGMMSTATILTSAPEIVLRPLMDLHIAVVSVLQAMRSAAVMEILCQAMTPSVAK
jgi:hypothetical protein